MGPHSVHIGVTLSRREGLDRNLLTYEPISRPDGVLRLTLSHGGLGAYSGTVGGKRPTLGRRSRPIQSGANLVTALGPHVYRVGEKWTTLRGLWLITWSGERGFPIYEP